MLKRSLATELDKTRSIVWTRAMGTVGSIETISPRIAAIKPSGTPAVRIVKFMRRNGA